MAAFSPRACAAAILMHRYGVPCSAAPAASSTGLFHARRTAQLQRCASRGPLSLITLAMAVAMPQMLPMFNALSSGDQGIGLVEHSRAARHRPRSPGCCTVLLVLGRRWSRQNLLMARQRLRAIGVVGPITAAGHGHRRPAPFPRGLQAFRPGTLFTGVPSTDRSRDRLCRESFGLFLSLSFLVAPAAGALPRWRRDSAPSRSCPISPTIPQCRAIGRLWAGNAIVHVRTTARALWHAWAWLAHAMQGCDRRDTQDNWKEAQKGGSS